MSYEMIDTVFDTDDLIQKLCLDYGVRVLRVQTVGSEKNFQELCDVSLITEAQMAGIALNEPREIYFEDGDHIQDVLEVCGHKDSFLTATLFGKKKHKKEK